MTHEAGGPRTSVYERHPELKTIPDDAWPEYIVIIPDGNRTWAKTQVEQLAVIEGHKAGMGKILELLEDFEELPIKKVGFWAFSGDNWARRKKDKKEGELDEVDLLLEMLNQGIRGRIDRLHAKGYKLEHLGRKDRIGKVNSALVETLQNAEALTKNNTGKIIELAIDYGGEEENARMKREEAREFFNLGRVVQGELTEGEWVKIHQPFEPVHPDMIIRTKVPRTSGWPIGAQTYFAFVDKNFPEIEIADVAKALIGYAGTTKNFGA